jgi:hypothetical protein
LKFVDDQLIAAAGSIDIDVAVANHVEAVGHVELKP